MGFSLNKVKNIGDNKTLNDELEYKFHEDSSFCMIHNNSEESAGNFSITNNVGKKTSYINQIW